MSSKVYLPAMAVATCLGVGKTANAEAVFSGVTGLAPNRDLLPGRTIVTGALPQGLPPLPASFGDLDSRNNRLLALMLNEISKPIDRAIRTFGHDRIAVVLGTSTSGIAEGEHAFAHRLRKGDWPPNYAYTQQETGSAAALITRLLGLGGPAYVIATACSSAAKTFASARRLLRQGIADAAIVGGADTLSGLTAAGFSSLEAVSASPCNPFSRNRDGISIGEGGALFLMTREAAEIALVGIGETSDAYHVSAPEPSGAGATAAMRSALADACMHPKAIDYINAHGTATPLNDAMESRAIHNLFGETVPCSSTKAMTGHTLGAAGAVEAALIWLTLSRQWNPKGYLPPQVWDGEADPALPRLNMVQKGAFLTTEGPLRALSNSFAFGGSNCTLILERP